MSHERRERQKAREQRSVVAWADRYWPTIRNWIVGLGIGDVILDNIKGRIKEAVMEYLKGYAKWILVNPFALLTAGVIAVLILVLYKVLDGYFEARRELRAGFASHIPYEHRYRPHFFAQAVVTIIVSVGAIGYGAYYTYTHPLPVVVSVSKSWFAEHHKSSDVYAAVIIRNYSDKPTRVYMDHYSTVWDVKGENGDPTIPAANYVTLPAWEEFTARFEINFHGSQYLLDAYHRNGIKVYVSVKYNNGFKNVNYETVGLIDYGSVRFCSGCEGNIDLIKETTTTD
jgi:hypothetical protein